MGTISSEIQNHVAILTIDSPPANALSTSILHDLNEQLDMIEKNTTVKVIILRGKGRFFSAGADIKEFTGLQDSNDYQSLSEYGQQLFDRIEHFSIPVIASIHGAALGGGLELAMACHIRLVTPNAKLGLPETTLGIIPGFGGTQRLPRYVGSAKAYEMILTGIPISGSDAKTYGLCNHVVEEDELVKVTNELAEKIACKSKPTIQRVMDLLPLTHVSTFSEGIASEAQAFATVFGTDDAKEGVRAFIEKRKPNFQDK